MQSITFQAFLKKVPTQQIINRFSERYTKVGEWYLDEVKIIIENFKKKRSINMGAHLSIEKGWPELRDSNGDYAYGYVNLLGAEIDRDFKSMSDVDLICRILYYFSRDGWEKGWLNGNRVYYDD